MNTLVINTGSTTIKFKLFDNHLQELISGVIDRKDTAALFTLHKASQTYKWEISLSDFANATSLILKELKEYDFAKVGFRVVHGGEKYTEPTLLGSDVIQDLELLSDLAPLHNPPAIERIKEFAKLTDKPLYAVFDTAFHATIPKAAFLYAIPYEFYQKYGIRRFGFHGISHKYVFNILKELEPENHSKVLTCHLGGGASITAVKEGQSYDTSMGFTPLEGLIMATRPGDIDDGAIHYLMSKMHMSVKDMQNIENNFSGLLGISGRTSDMRELLALEAEGHERAHLAIEMYLYRIRKYIGAYSAVMNGCDAIVITAGVGAGSDVLRQRVFQGLEHLKFFIADETNTGQINVSSNLKISTSQSKPIWIIPTNEELQIAAEIKEL